jgi:hypothetical protein
MMEVVLPGMFPPAYAPSGRVNLSQLMRDYKGQPRTPIPPTRVADARPTQAGQNEAEFFDEHGFVLLNAPHAVTDWGDKDNVAANYLPQVEEIIRTRLYPGRKLIVMQPPTVMRRGARTDTPQYGTGVHCDHDRTADDYQHNVAAFVGDEMAGKWREGFEKEEVETFVVLDFWRPTMDEPLRHMPLVLCDPNSIEPEDMVSSELEGIAPNGGATRHISLKHNGGQRWYYYPEMTADEVLVFKLFELRKGEEPQRFRACLHAAVDDPSTPPDAPHRQSTEHRVSVMLLR